MEHSPCACLLAGRLAALNHFCQTAHKHAQRRTCTPACKLKHPFASTDASTPCTSERMPLWPTCTLGVMHSLWQHESLNHSLHGLHHSLPLSGSPLSHPSPPLFCFINLLLSSLPSCLLLVFLLLLLPSLV